MFSVIIVQILDSKCFSTPGHLHFSSLRPDLPLKMEETVVPLVSCKAEHALCFLFHFHFPQLAKYGGSIKYLKYLERSLQSYGQAKQRSRIMSIWINWLLPDEACIQGHCNCQVCRYADLMTSKPTGTDWIRSYFIVPQWPKPCSCKLSKFQGNFWFYDTLSFCETFGSTSESIWTNSRKNYVSVQRSTQVDRRLTNQLLSFITSFWRFPETPTPPLPSYEASSWDLCNRITIKT